MNRLAPRYVLSFVAITKEWIPNFEGNAVNFECFSPTFLIFKQIKVGLCYYHAVFMPVYPHYQFLMAKPIFMELGMYIVAPEFISKVYFINTLISLYLYAYHLTLLGNSSVRTRQRIHATVEKLFVLILPPSSWSLTFP
jgi:hypothetical protein